MQGNNKLPPEILEKKTVIISMCKKLDDDDANINGAVVGGGLKLSTAILGLVGVVGVVISTHYDVITLKKLKSILSRSVNKRCTVGKRLGHREGDSDSMAKDIVRATLKSQGESERISAIREARLRAFEMNDAILSSALPGTDE